MAGLRGLEFYLSEYHAKGDVVFAELYPYPVLAFGRLERASDTGVTTTEGLTRDMAQLVAQATQESLRKLGNLSRTTVLELSPREVRPGRPRVTLGRGHDNDVVLPQSTVSKNHAAFEQLADGRWALHDLRSRNGTLLNGHRLRADWPAATLEDRDRLTFGSVATTFFSAATFRQMLADLLPG